MACFNAEILRTADFRLTVAQQNVTQCIVLFLGIRPQANFTPHVVSTWCRVLGEFDQKIVNQAVLECGLSQLPYVGLPEIFQRCRELSRSETEYCPVRNEKKIPKSLIHKIANALGVDAGQKNGRNIAQIVRSIDEG